MASVEHCLVCFEALDAELNNRTRLSLEQVQSSWAAYKKSVSNSNSNSNRFDVPLKNRALSRVAAGDSSSSSLSTASSSSSSTSLAAASASASAAAAASTPATSTSSLPNNIAPASAPLFVTWNTVSSSSSSSSSISNSLDDNDNDDDDDDDADDDDDESDVSLRGCIGTFEAQPLSRGLPEYALISALQDSRFPPVSRRELPSLQAAVTLLTDFEAADDAFDWEVGVHGIRLSFSDRGRRYGATYLPDVALEQGWSKEQALFSLVRKAGWMGSRSRWRDLELKVTRYQGKKVSLNYPEFKKWRDWVSSKQL